MASRLFHTLVIAGSSLAGVTVTVPSLLVVAGCGVSSGQTKDADWGTIAAPDLASPYDFWIPIMPNPDFAVPRDQADGWVVIDLAPPGDQVAPKDG